MYIIYKKKKKIEFRGIVSGIVSGIGGEVCWAAALEPSI